MLSHQEEDLVVSTVQRHGAMVLGVARQHSLCEDDAHEAWQRAVEIFVRRAGRLDRATAHRWLATVVKRK